MDSIVTEKKEVFIVSTRYFSYLRSRSEGPSLRSRSTNIRSMHPESRYFTSSCTIQEGVFNVPYLLTYVHPESLVMVQVSLMRHSQRRRTVKSEVVVNPYENRCSLCISLLTGIIKDGDNGERRERESLYCTLISY